MTDKEKRKLVREDYNKIAQPYTKNFGDITQFIPYIDEFASGLKGNRVVDMGCGAGQVVNYLSGKGLKAIGVDFSKNLLKIAKSNYPKLKFVNKDILKFRPLRKFDGIITKYTLFHFSDNDVQIVLSKFKNMLNPDGRLCVILDVPSKDSEKIITEELDDRYKVYYNYMTPIKVEKLLTSAGFVVEKKTIVNVNKDALIYTSGIMVFQCGLKKIRS